MEHVDPLPLLPPELILEIVKQFILISPIGLNSNLIHGRLVCKAWNELIAPHTTFVPDDFVCLQVTYNYYLFNKHS